MDIIRIGRWSCVAVLLGTGASWAAEPGSAMRTVVAQAPMSARSALALPIPEISVDGITLSRVIDFFRNASGANIVVDWKVLESVGVSKDTPVTLQVKNLSLKKMLQLALDQASPSTPLVFTVDQNVIEITTQDDADSHLVTRTYDVNELVMPERLDVVPPSLDISQSLSQASATGGGGGGGNIFTQTSSQTSTDTKEKRGQDLVTVIRTVVRPTIWRENGGTASIQYIMGELIVTAPVSVQEAIGGPPLSEKSERYGM